MTSEPKEERMTPVKQCSDCRHPKESHKYESGFYDVRGHYAECNYVGCPCTRYR